ncbi:Uncharacterised protein [BD1-7 clade bacterium]|uniref:Uncharacterized protein n=1 Tax=BD1-7 clade bacterium TaxID=2029982 RepID=A0A5S9QXP4_9GAMM|nr:Uncharacterised protein [BD1-7 clade bacterium]
MLLGIRIGNCCRSVFHAAFLACVLPITASTVQASQSCPSQPDDHIKGKLRTNDLNIKTSSADLDLGELSFSYDGDYCVVNGQPWSGVEQDWSSDNLKITVYSGRKGKSDGGKVIAKSFADKTNNNATQTIAHTSPPPGKLNFYACGTLEFNDYQNNANQAAAVDLCVAQGTSNNWWVGGSDWVKKGSSICYADSNYRNGVDGLAACLDPSSTTDNKIWGKNGGAHLNELFLYSIVAEHQFSAQEREFLVEYLSGLGINKILVEKIIPKKLTLKTKNISYQCSGNANCSQKNVDYTIAGNQLWAGVDSGVPDGGSFKKQTLSVTAGRSAGSGPAEWLKNDIGGSYIGTMTFSDAPSKLNFAFCGDLAIDTESMGICMGQGSPAASPINNWWTGGKGWKTSKMMDVMPLLKVLLKPSQYRLIEGFGGVSGRVAWSYHAGTLVLALTISTNDSLLVQDFAKFFVPVNNGIILIGF